MLIKRQRNGILFFKRPCSNCIFETFLGVDPYSFSKYVSFSNRSSQSFETVLSFASSSDNIGLLGDILTKETITFKD